MENRNFIDFYIGYPGHPSFRDLELIEDDIVRVIVQKYEMIIFTNKGDLLFDLDFGSDLVKILHETRLSADSVEANLESQVLKYIPELSGVDYTIDVEFFEHPTDFIEFMVVDFQLSGYQVTATIH